MKWENDPYKEMKLEILDVLIRLMPKNAAETTSLAHASHSIDFLVKTLTTEHPSNQ
jgi:hypothetical protein